MAQQGQLERQGQGQQNKMTELKIETFMELGNTRTLKITGLTEEELSELNSMDYREMKETLVDLMNRIEAGTGTRLQRGYGIYTAWIRNGAAYVDVGTSCD